MSNQAASAIKKVLSEMEAHVGDGRSLNATPDTIKLWRAALLTDLQEIETICTESAGDCRKRMGTRVGNVLSIVRKALS